MIEVDVSLEQASYNVQEDVGVVTVCVELTEGELCRPVTLDIATSNTTATGQ